MELYQFLEGNIDALREAKAAAYTWLSSVKYDMEKLRSSIFVNKWGFLDWRMENGSGMFDPAPPEAFFGGWKTVEKADTSATIMLGMNLGYGLNHLLRTTPLSHKIVVLDPRPEMILACLGQSDYRQHIAMKRIHIMPPSEDYLHQVIKHLDLQFMFGKIYLREDLASRQLGPEYARWSNILKAKLENFSVELSTLRRKQDVMVGNELRNFSRSVKDGGTAPLKEAARGLTAVILGAGPSLSRFAPLLAENPGNALYATALQTLPALLSKGITPHFAMAIDYSEGMHYVYSRLDMDKAKEIPLVYSTKLAPSVLKRYPGPTIPLWTMGGISSFIKREDNELVMDAGGNVGVALFRFLAWCGVKDFLLAGQDFGCPLDGATHADGHHASNLSVASNPAFNQRIKNADGLDIATSQQLLAAKRDLEEDIAKHEVNVLNLYGGGAVIEGARIITPEDLEGESLLSCGPRGLCGFLEAIDQARTPKKRPIFEQRSHIWTSSLRQVEKRLEKLFKHPERNQDDIHKTISQLELFIKQDPLYFPYLFNEIADVAGMVRAVPSYEPKHLGSMKKILKRVVTKVREMDRCLSPQAVH